MKCPKCGAALSEGQNYCGGCGHQLKNVCSGCGTINPPFFKFCGQCGRNLADVGTILLDRAGLILEADAAARDILRPPNGGVTGKPFALFVDVEDLVLYYSHWNELIRSGRRQNLEIELHPTPDTVLHVQLVLRRLDDHDREGMRIRMEIGDVTDRRQIMQALQEKQDYIELVVLLNDLFQPHDGHVPGDTIGGVLEKIGLLSESGYGFVARFDARGKRLHTLSQWDAAGASGEAPPPPVALQKLRPVLEKLHRGRPYVVEDLTTRPPHERHTWRSWQHRPTGAVQCHLIYRRHKPIGIIGLAKTKSGHWPREIVALVKLAGRLMADTLPHARPGLAIVKPMATSPSKVTPATETVDIEDIEIIVDEDDQADTEDKIPARMQITSDDQAGFGDGLRVFPAEDGDYQIRCPHCSRQETVGPPVFAKLGAVLKVTCPCGDSFRILRELRHAFRKAVRLDGLFAQNVSDLNKMAVVNVWGPMVVTNLSKSGLSFTAEKAGLLKPGDRVHLRFYLDNSSKTLIKKPALVKSVQGDTVGCQFEGTDRHDVTLGFYFL
jgi:hypothetical protein